MKNTIKAFTVFFAVAGLALSCQKNTEVPASEEGEKGFTISFTAAPITTKTTFGAKAGTSYPTLWQSSDKVLVSKDMEAPVSASVTPSADFKTADFSVEFASEGTDYYALSPESAFVGGSENANDKSVKVKVPSIQTPTPSSCDPGAQILYASVTPPSGATSATMNFSHALAYGRITLKNLSLGEGVAINSVTLISSESLAGEATLTYPAGTLSVGAGEQSLTINTSSASGIWFACLPANLDGKQLKVKVTTSEGFYTKVITATGLSFVQGEVFPMEIDMDGITESDIEVVWAYGGDSKLPKFHGLYPAVDNDGNVYVTGTGSTDLFKFNNKGELAWRKPLHFTGPQDSSPSVEPDGSTVYAGGGSSGDAAYNAYSADGTLKWTFGKSKFYAASGTPSPSIRRIHAAIGDNNIYIGNGGTTGSVITIDKATGNRVSYVPGNADGTGGPAGGCNSGIAISKNGAVAWLASYGFFAAQKSELDNPSNSHATFGKYAPYGVRYLPTGLATSYDGVACANIGGEDCIMTSAMIGSAMHIVCAKADAALDIAPDNSSTYLYDHTINGAQKQDQGGIIVGPRNEAIVAMKNNSTVPGGIYAVAADGSMAYRYEVGEDVVIGCAVDNNGYIHFVTDKNSEYYIVKPDYSAKTCELISKVSVFNLIRQAGINVGSHTSTRTWSNVILGNDGKMYLATTLGNAEGVLLCLSYDRTTSPSAASPWPMRGSDPFHTGRQK